MTTAIVVGSGPNGLAAATVLARSGVEVTVLEASEHLGGGARSVETPIEGLLQDHCAAVHPMAPGSAYLQSLDLGAMGIEWGYAPYDAAHPLDDGDVALLSTSVTETAESLGPDGRRWAAMFGSPSKNFDKLAPGIMAPMLRVPKHPLLLARFGMVAGPPPALVAKMFRDERARALFMGVAAHAMQPLTLPLVTGIGAGIIAAGHSVGWPVVKGGTGKFTEAVIALLRDLGVRFETGHRVSRLHELPRHDLLILDVHPHAAASILAGHQPSRARRAYQKFKPGPAAFKVDLAIEGGIPWRNPETALAGTVHLGGSAAEIIAAEREVSAGRMPQRPFVLVGQQYVADPARALGSIVPVYAYAHVPNGFAGDASEQVIAQIERFAPGVRERIVATSSRSVAQAEAENANFVGGDILTGAKSPLQFLLGPRITAQPYDTGVPGVYLCSAATPPGPGIHGMGGYNAAHRALRLV
ncbi:NAD(P)/FAD-dependent oxidoreductase [Leucobacter sp. UT-8R-CII-1-4]|uniref:phytoene desaturase family protein n=1 Tax=Leucobacter sp. UT-8R-CII-1-4 TaxID=3040075 RepID=UPI0024A9B64A|nr:NAD(P)/FAD-dependent oxidoreductase [Leucobacter sp. UT-8R-CII-1-4]MDI6022564.1 NAD(P)/FAD-dependent oxidoreductase [Leucobacter sp. UT-8R-CII-1-4]